MKTIAFISLLISTVFGSYLSGLDRSFAEADFKMIDLHFSMPPSELEKLLDIVQITTGQVSNGKSKYLDDFEYKNTTMVATLNGKEKVFENVKFKTGGMYARSHDKVGFNFKLNEKFLGRKQLRIRPDANDKSYMRSKISCDLANRTGVPSIQATYARVYMNDEYWGLYTLMDAIKPSWVKQTFKPDVEEVTDLIHCKNKGMNMVLGTESLCLNANDDYPDMTKFNEFIKQVNEATTTEELEKIMDVDVFLRYMVLEWLTGSFDQFLVLGHNFYFYQREGDNKWVLIEYDYDNTFNNGISSPTYWIGKNTSSKKTTNNDNKAKSVNNNDNGTNNNGNVFIVNRSYEEEEEEEDIVTVTAAATTTTTITSTTTTKKSAATNNRNGFNGNFNWNFNNTSSWNFNNTSTWNFNNTSTWNFNNTSTWNFNNTSNGNFGGFTMPNSNLVEYSFEEWELDIPIIKILVYDNPERFKRIVREVLVSSFNPSILNEHIDQLKEFLLPYVVEDTTPGPDGSLPGRINKKGQKNKATVENFEGNVEGTIKKGLKTWINQKFEVACQLYDFDPEEIIAESAKYKAHGYDYQKGKPQCYGEKAKGKKYPCCKRCKSLYKDKKGKWGIEKGKKCSIKYSC